MSTPESIKIKQARRQIFHNLDLVYPSGLFVRYLYQTVCAIDEMYDFNLFAKDIAYLRAKNYIYFIDDIVGVKSPFERKIVKLTASGKEIAEQTRADPALEI